MKLSAFFLSAAVAAHQASGYAFVAKRSILSVQIRLQQPYNRHREGRRGQQCGSHTAMQMVDQNVIQGAGIAIAGLAVGIGLVAFTEAQGERAKARGGGLSETMSTRIAGALLEDVEVSSVSDISSLTSQLEKALKESGGASEQELVMTEEDKKRITDEADDGW